MPSTVTMDCSTLSPVSPTSRVYFECWGNRELPATMSFSAGPAFLVPPATVGCSGWPTGGVITGTLTRTGPCDFVWGYSSGSFTILFAWTAGGKPVGCTINQTSLIGHWGLGNPVGPASGSCSQDPSTGVVTFTYTGSISNGLCRCPVTVTYYG